MRLLFTVTMLIATASLVLATGCGTDPAPTPDADTTGQDTTTDQVSPDASPESDAAAALDSGVPTDLVEPTDTSLPPADTGVDTAPSDTAAPVSTCLDHMQCMMTACSAKGGAEAESCLLTAATTCGVDAEDTEGGLAATYATCLGASACSLPDMNNPLSETWADFYKCASSTCGTEAASCLAGPTPGEGNCEELRLCIKTCEPDFLTGKPSNSCMRGCAELTTEESVNLYVDLNFCILEICYDKPDLDTCYTQTVGTYCPNQNDLCYGTQL